MKNQQITDNNKKGTILTIIGIIAMVLLTITKVVPSSQIAGYTVFVGIAFFFIVETVAKMRGSESGLRFNTIATDFKKPKVILWTLLPIVTGPLGIFIGNLIFGTEFVSHLLGRVDNIISLDKIATLIPSIIIAAWGEEIAFRGFFLGKTMKKFPFWICAVVSSVVFATGHIVAGNVGIVAYDIATVFIDSLIFSIIYKKTENCMISTFSHILGNTMSFVTMSVLF